MLAIISDTHENEPAIKKAVRIIKEKNSELCVHCGDIVSPPMLEHFRGLKMKLVYGNNDGERIGLNIAAKKLGFEELKDEKEFVFRGKKFYVYHGTNPAKLNAAIKSNKYDYVLTGHTHIKSDEISGKTRVINPGALFRVNDYTIALLDIDKDKVEFINIK